MCPNDPIGSAEVSWHAGDGSSADGGNMTSLSIEIIMHNPADEGNSGIDEPYKNIKAYNNGARLAAWLLCRNGLGIDRLVTHTYWVNKAVGNQFADRDKQCTNLVKGKKWCPAYILGASNSSRALCNWKLFKKAVEEYCCCYNK